MGRACSMHRKKRNTNRILGKQKCHISWAATVPCPLKKRMIKMWMCFSHWTVDLKVKVKLPQCSAIVSTTPWRCIWKWMCRSSFFFILALLGKVWSASCPGHLTHGERAPVMCWIGKVGPRDGLDDVEERKFLAQQELELQSPGHPACSQLLYRLCYPGSLKGRHRQRKLS
jgi:hypothetical protein